MSLQRAWRERLNAYRNPVYIVYMLAAVGLLLLAIAISNPYSVGPLERSIFRVFNDLPDWLNGLFVAVSLFGTIGFALLVGLIPLARRHYATAAKFLLAGSTAYVLAYWLKTFDIRARPALLLDNVQLREQTSTTMGLPSGHVAVATALAIVAYQYVPKKYHRYITGLVLGVAASRLYLGAHLPLDLVGGFAVGLFVGAFYSFLFGRIMSLRYPVSLIKKRLHAVNFPVASVETAKVDARGSTPYFVTAKDGRKYFLKVVGQDNYISDWLFKLWRKVIYRRLEDEVPFLSPKRQIEHESYVAGLALANGIKTPQIVGVIKINAKAWAQMQTGIDGRSLDKVEPVKITDKMLVDIWTQVNQMHQARIIHRDLRTANIFLDKQGTIWMIDFGFAEASVGEESFHRDIVELLASMSTLVGVQRTVDSAAKVISQERLARAAPYLSYASLSTATERTLKRRKKILPELQAAVLKASGLKTVKEKRQTRVNRRSLLIIGASLIALYVLLPQLDDFHKSLQAVKEANISFLAWTAVFSIGTYLAAAMEFKFLAIYPMRFGRTLLVQVASSFTNRLLPASAGSIATFTKYLQKQGHNSHQALAIVSVNNLLGFVGLMAIMFFVAVASKTPLSQAFTFNLPRGTILVALAASLVLVALLGLWNAMRNKIVGYLRSLAGDFQTLAANPARLLAALILSMIITVLYGFALYASAHALGQPITVLQTFVVLTIGVAAASVTPTPGGIGGAEAGFVAGLASVGVPTEIGISIALVYRLITFWLPILPGFICFQIALKRRYV